MNTRDVIEVLKGKLKPYLEETGRLKKSGTNIKCPIPSCYHKHGDRNPSAGFVPGSNETLVHCFTSGKTADIFHIYCADNKLPMVGSNFYTITVPQLAEMYGIEYESEDISEEQKEKIQRFRAYRDAAMVVSRYPNPTAEPMLELRGWTTNIASQMLIGSVESFASYINEMQSMGWSEEYLKDIELANTSMFNEENLIFTICTADGCPTAFVARNMTYEQKIKEGISCEKYRNSSAAVYNKGRTLYTFHLARNGDPTGNIWLFEGYADAVTARLYGLQGACATGGTAITEEHIEMLSATKARTINIAFDGDQEGINAVTRAIEKHFQKKVPLNFRIVKIPNQKDPDEYIREYGLSSFLEIPRKTVFEWMITNGQEDADEEEMAKKAIPLILSEEDRISRFFLANTLSERTGIPARRIMDEVERRERDEDHKIEEKIEYIKKSTIRKLEGSDPPEITLSDALSKIETLRNVKPLDESYFISELESIKTKFLNPITGYDFGYTQTNEEIVPNLPTLHSGTDGLPRHGSLVVVSGIPGTGKTSFMRYLFYHVAKANNDVRVIFMSIDDNKAKIYQSLITLFQNIPLTKVRKYHTLTPEERVKWEQGWDQLQHFWNRFTVYDANNGTTIRHLEDYIRRTQERYPDDQIIAILDNFHKLTDFGSFTDDKTKNAYCVSMIKNLTTKYDVPIFMTVELRKLQSMSTKPTMNDLKDTVQISYDADMIWLLHNEMHINPDTQLSWNSVGEDGLKVTKKPIIELSIVKNKETGWKGTIMLKFDDERSSFKEVPREELNRIKNATGNTTSIARI